MQASEKAQGCRAQNSAGPLSGGLRRTRNQHEEADNIRQPPESPKAAVAPRPEIQPISVAGGKLGCLTFSAGGPDEKRLWGCGTNRLCGIRAQAGGRPPELSGGPSTATADGQNHLICVQGAGL